MKKAILTLLMIPAFVGMLFSCSEVKTDAKKLEGKWNIVEVKGEKILKEGLPNMEFDMKDNKVHGNAGCNIFNSTVVLAGLHTFHVSHSFQDRIFDLHIRTSHHGSGCGVDRDGRNILVDADGNVLMVLSKN